MSIITIATSKGGAGKTTIAELLLGTFAQDGHKVAGIDADLNSTLTNWVTVLSKYPIEVVTELEEGNIIPLAGKLEAENDVVIIDTAGTSTQATVFAIGCADLVLIPVQLSSADIVEAIKTHKLVKSAGEMTKRNIEARVVFTDFQPNTNISEYVDAEIERYGLPTMKTKLHRLVAFKEMTFTGKVPRIGTAGAQASLLIQEIQKLGVLPFLNKEEVVGEGA